MDAALHYLKGLLDRIEADRGRCEAEAVAHENAARKLRAEVSKIDAEFEQISEAIRYLSPKTEAAA